MSDQIKKYLETPEIPDKFKPENIHLILDVDIAAKRRRKNIARTFASVAAAACVFVGAGVLYTKNNKFKYSEDNAISFEDNIPEYIIQTENEMNFEQIESYKDIYQALDKNIYTDGDHNAIVGGTDDIKNNFSDSVSKNPEDNKNENHSVIRNEIIYELNDSILSAFPSSESDNTENTIMTADLYELTGIDKKMILKNKCLGFTGNILYVVLEINDYDDTMTGIFTFDISENKFSLKNNWFVKGNFYTEILENDTVYIVSEHIVVSVSDDTDISDIQKYIPCAGNAIDDIIPMSADDIYRKINPDINNTAIRYAIVSKVTDKSIESISGAVNYDSGQDFTLEITELITDVFC